MQVQVTRMNNGCNKISQDSAMKSARGGTVQQDAVCLLSLQQGNANSFIIEKISTE
jgi:hypothetical protein